MAVFNEDHLHAVFDKVSYENKNIVLLDDFSIDLLHYVHCVKSFLFDNKLALCENCTYSEFF